MKDISRQTDCFAIAYAKYDGSDFYGKPWLEVGFSSPYIAERARRKLVTEAKIQKSFIFALPKEHPEEISWEYAKLHLIQNTERNAGGGGFDDNKKESVI